MSSGYDFTPQPPQQKIIDVPFDDIEIIDEPPYNHPQVGPVVGVPVVNDTNNTFRQTLIDPNTGKIIPEVPDLNPIPTYEEAMEQKKNQPQPITSSKRWRPFDMVERKASERRRQQEEDSLINLLRREREQANQESLRDVDEEYQKAKKILGKGKKNKKK